uniref:protein MARD1-like n=1 Tax=Erigeron canadensis TaxID=72917 RepID=UPI001CB8A803|nr:protein MARD1-like [Erigeron canadensis]
MGLSEEYKKVISYGSNPKTTHTYDNYVLDSDPKTPWQSFLSFCHTCKEHLEDGCDIFMYRGEKNTNTPSFRVEIAMEHSRRITGFMMVHISWRAPHGNYKVALAIPCNR